MDEIAINLVAKFATLAALAFRTSYGLPPVYPRKDMTYTENLMYMMFSDPMDPEWRPNPLHVEAMDKFLILHADHEQNASTSTVRITGSSLANPLTCISSGIACLWGPSHGGANQACLEMLDQIGTRENVPKYVEMAKDKSNKFRIMGFGHRVYKNYDPRSKVMEEMCHEIIQ